MSFKFTISTESLVEASDKTYEVTPELVLLVRLAITSLLYHKRQMSYSEVFGDMSDPVYRNKVKEALWILWCYCDYRSVPWLNFLVVSDKTQFPGNRVKKWYKDVFGSEVGYQEYCQLQARASQLLIEHGLITI
jgi:hypothetical protein